MALDMFSNVPDDISHKYDFEFVWRSFFKCLANNFLWDFGDPFHVDPLLPGVIFHFVIFLISYIFILHYVQATKPVFVSIAAMFFFSQTESVMMSFRTLHQEAEQYLHHQNCYMFLDWMVSFPGLKKKITGLKK